MSIAIVRVSPLSKFAETARLNQSGLLRAFLISPWIVVNGDEEFTPLIKLILAAKESGARLTVITRPPTLAGHDKAIKLIARLVKAEILFMRNLHAKLYLLECNGLRAGMFGSPNFTPYGDKRNVELAADVRSVRSTDLAAQFLDDLFVFARELMSDPDVRIVKKLGESN
jgi:hypothetical protein